MEKENDGNGDDFQLIRFTTDSPIDDLIVEIFGEGVELIKRVNDRWEGKRVYTYHLRVKVSRRLSD